MNLIRIGNFRDGLAASILTACGFCASTNVLTAEVTKEPSADFKKADLNGDGKIDAEEFAKFLQSHPAEIPKAPSPQERSAPLNAQPSHLAEMEISQKIMERLDVNGDGKIDKSEAPPRLLEVFDQFDTNHDGFLSSGDAGVMKRVKEHVKGKGKGGAPNLIQKHDENKDGKLQKEECPTSLQKRFEELDKNHDGALDANEIKEFREETGKAPIKKKGALAAKASAGQAPASADPAVPAKSSDGKTN